MEALKALPWSSADALGAARRGQEAQTSSESQQPPDREPESSSWGGSEGPRQGTERCLPWEKHLPVIPALSLSWEAQRAFHIPPPASSSPAPNTAPFLPCRGFSWPFSKPCDAEGGREVTFKPQHSCSRGGSSPVKTQRVPFLNFSGCRRGLGAGASLPREPPNEMLRDYN